MFKGTVTVLACFAVGICFVPIHTAFAVKGFLPKVAVLPLPFHSVSSKLRVKTYGSRHSLNGEKGNNGRDIIVDVWYDFLTNHYQALVANPSSADLIFIPIDAGDKSMGTFLCSGKIAKSSSGCAKQLIDSINRLSVIYSIPFRRFFVVFGAVCSCSKHPCRPFQLRVEIEREVQTIALEQLPTHRFWDQRSNIVSPHATTHLPLQDDFVKTRDIFVVFYSDKRHLSTHAAEYSSFCPRNSSVESCDESNLHGQRSRTKGQNCHFILRSLLSKQLAVENTSKVIKFKHWSPKLAEEEMRNSIFCLQPPGDTFTRKAIFDAFATGCIPVVFFNSDSFVASFPFSDIVPYRSMWVYLPARFVFQDTQNVIRWLSHITTLQLLTIRRNIQSHRSKILLLPGGLLTGKYRTANCSDSPFTLTLRTLYNRSVGN
mmetsp:Transcript_17377/g.42960  ORF Transcript_17377/g.42960 Transcript_17377/m.42960 type:complete len:429 (-) Transcript_17377:212-1498(-)